VKLKLFLPLFITVFLHLSAHCFPITEPGARIDQLKSFAQTLSLSDASSILRLTEKFEEIYEGASPEECDEAVIFIVEFMSRSTDSIYIAHEELINREAIFLYCDNYTREQGIEIKEDPEVKIFAEEALKSGYRFTLNEGMGEINKSPDFPGENILRKLSPAMREYYIQMSSEEKAGFAHDAGLTVGPEELGDRIVWREKYLDKYPGSAMKEQLIGEISFLSETLKTGVDNTPAFDYETGRLTKEFEDAYKKIIARYPDSPTAKKLNEYYKKVKANRLKRIEE